jgi:CheY-like chemotaxis protein
MHALPPILIVDDNAEARECLTVLLQMQGVRNIAGANSGEEALELLARERFGLIICDYHLGGMDGLEFITNFRARGDTTPVLLLTGSGDESIRAGTAPHARVGFFTKPFTSGQLAEQIQRLMAA